MALKDLLHTIVSSIVDDETSVQILEKTDDNGDLLEVQVGADDVGKVIGKKGRIANAIRTIVKAAGAKQSVKIMVNISKNPFVAGVPTPDQPSETLSDTSENPAAEEG